MNSSRHTLLQSIVEGIGKGLGEKIGEALVAGISALLSLGAASLAILSRHNLKLLLVFAAIAVFLLLVLLVSLWAAYRRSTIAKPVEPTPRPLTSQERRQQRINQDMEFLDSVKKPTQAGFEALKFLAMNPRDSTLNAQGIASLYCGGSIAAAQGVISELRSAGYIERAGPAMPGDGNNHYRITERGNVCVDIHAA